MADMHVDFFFLIPAAINTACSPVVLELLRQRGGPDRV